MMLDRERQDLQRLLQMALLNMMILLVYLKAAVLDMSRLGYRQSGIGMRFDGQTDAGLSVEAIPTTVVD